MLVLREDEYKEGSLKIFFSNKVDIKSAKQKMTLDELIAFIKNPREPMPRVYSEPLSAADERSIREIATFIMQWK